MRLSIVIPVYNEINTILEVLRQVKATPFKKEIIIVDDGSTDGTRQVLKNVKAKNIKIYFNKKNRGKGFCLRKGFKQVSGDIVIIQDADLEYYPDEYPQLIEKIIEGKADVVYGTRFLGARRVFNFYHYLGNRLLNFIANFLYNVNLSDLMTCYKAFKEEALERLELCADGFGIEAEITAQICKANLKLYEVPISYNGRDYEEGKKIVWKDFFRCLYWLIKCKLENYDIGRDTLGRMRLLKNNNKWVFEQIKSYLKGNVLEVGSGVGNISKFLVFLNKTLVLTDIRKDYLDYLKSLFGANPNIKILKHDILLDNPAKLSPFKINAVVCINVLEHIKDDRQALKNIYKILQKGGSLILVVPALKMLFGSLDKNLGHFRRYEKEALEKTLKSLGFKVKRTYYHNFFSALGWFFNNRILNQKIMNRVQISLLDRLIPVFVQLEKKVKIPFGLSLVIVCQKK